MSYINHLFDWKFKSFDCLFTKSHFKANFDADLFFMDCKQNQYLNRGDYIKTDKNSTNLQ